MKAEQAIQIAALSKTIRTMQTFGMKKERIQEQLEWIRRNYALSSEEFERLLELVR